MQTHQKRKLSFIRSFRKIKSYENNLYSSSKKNYFNQDRTQKFKRINKEYSKIQLLDQVHRNKTTIYTNKLIQNIKTLGSSSFRS
jgi:hypothetical protein